MQKSAKAFENGHVSIKRKKLSAQLFAKLLKGFKLLLFCFEKVQKK